MAVEPERACGYRKVGGLYLVGGGPLQACDRGPVPIEPCKVCGEEPRFTRGIASINPYRLFSDHPLCRDGDTCPLCHPPEKAFMMWIGKEYTPDSFIDEAFRLGVSKRIPFIPAEMTVGVGWVYLAYKNLIPTERKSYILPLEGLSRRGFKPGIFYAFKPRALEFILTESQAQDETKMAALAEKGITPIIVPDDDKDHAPKRKRGNDDE